MSAPRTGLTVVPAIDVRGGRVVRLRQGDASAETFYSDDPVSIARGFADRGAKRLHLVDLDAAIDGRPQVATVNAVIRAVSLPVEVGGGLRTVEDAARYRDAGADRIIFGTAAVIAPKVVQDAARRWPRRVAVALDARDGKVVIAGWSETTPVDARLLVDRIAAWGVTRVQYTDVARDGMLSGPNIQGIRALGRRGVAITVGGGVSSLEDIERIRGLRSIGVDEVILGRALYDERFTLAQAHAAAAGGRA